LSREWLIGKLPSNVEKEIKKKKLSSAEQVKLTKRTLDKYKRMQLDPGEAAGVITAQSLGEPGTQLSLKYDEEVLVKYKDSIKTIKIGEFIDTLIETQPTKQESKYEIYDLPENSNIEVLSLNSKEKLVWKKVKAISRHGNNEELLKLKLRSGRNITATRTHSFVIRKDNKIIPIAGKDLKLGSRIPVMRNLKFENEINSINVSEFVSSKWAKKKLPEVMELTEQLGWIFGAYLAEGNATPNFVNISNNSDVFMQQIQSFSSDFGFSVNSYRNPRGFSPLTRDIRINSKMLSSLLKSSCNTGSYNKRIPGFAINSNKRFIAGLLRGYFDGDGNVSVDRNVIRASSRSKELIDGISLLLNRFGIFSRKSLSKGGIEHTLAISHRYAGTFLEEIGLDIPKKLDNLKVLAKKVDSENQYNVTEMYIGFSDILYKLAEILKYPKRRINNFTKRQKIGRPTLKKYINIFSQLSEEQNVDVKKELKILKRIYDSDVIWDEIIGMEYVKDEHEYLYDFSVDGLETFTTKEGIVTHNTMRTFHFVGVGEMNVTLGLERIIEIVDIRRTPKTPAMQIYLNSPHNKNKKDVERIANKIKQVVLDEVASEFVLDLTSFSINIKINKADLNKHSLKLEELPSVLGKTVKGLQIKALKESITVSIKDKDLKKLYKIKDKLKEIPISGVKNVIDVLAVKRDDEYIIQTLGSNLPGVMSMDEVDSNRTFSNDLHETASVLGIEAARQTIINEIMKVLDEEGMPVDIRHIMLISDAMCKTGDLKGITRHGITKEKKSVLARASFEIPLTHLIEASVAGEEDKLTSVVENVMINQPIPVGTGLPELIVEMKETKFPASKPKAKMKETKFPVPKKSKKTIKKKTPSKKTTKPKPKVKPKLKMETKKVGKK